ncbi:putative lyase [Aquisphaera giovannonii]|uniref:Putative lyase n=1 Tax=Aquisphaera giovannonii TaxID=406548 RepID=A0A5B9WFU4_9BACT|nr:HEAT repeat domain-containing protein [Aquisphaera giovannonii]QEH38770.1 putative lyase [Aquisphaera giovannonii]
MSESGVPPEAWRSGLTSPNYRVRWKAIRGLGASRDPLAYDALVAAIGDRLPTIRIAALSALGRLRDRRAIGPAIEALKDPDAKVRDSAAAALKKFGKAAHAPMRDAYRDGDAGARLALLGALGRIKTPAISELLIAALDDPRDEIRIEAARVLGVRKDRRAVPRLLEAVAEGGPCLPAFIRALGEIGDPEALEPLRAILSAPAFMLRAEAATALRKIDNGRAVGFFCERLEEPDRDESGDLALTLAGTDLLGATESLVRRARASGDGDAIARAIVEVRRALDRHSAGLDAGRDDGPVAGAAGSCRRAGVESLRELERILRALGRGR